MASLLKDRMLKDRKKTPDMTAGAPDGDPAAVADFACHACGAGMTSGQDWCLECGTAAPGRLGARGGWRAAATVVTVMVMLVSGAVTASYAALTNDAERSAAAPSAGSGDPIAVNAAPGAPPITPGATGPGVTPPQTAQQGDGTPPEGTPIIPVKPPAPAKNSTLDVPDAFKATPPSSQKTPPAKDDSPSGGQSPSGGESPSTGDAPSGGQSASSPTAEIVKFKKGAASTYDPYERAGAEFGPAKNAIDKRKTTVWDVITPADDEPIGAGLLLDLGKRYDLRAVTLDTPTEGFDVEIYGAVSAKETPLDILDKRWEHIKDIKGVKSGDIVSLRKSEAKQRLLLIYVTTPAKPEDPRVAIGNVTVAGTP